MRRLLRNKLTPNIYTYNTLLSAFAKHGHPSVAEFWLDHMQRAARWRHKEFPIHQVSIAYTEVLCAYVRSGNMQAAEAWHSQMLGEGIEPDSRAYSALIAGHLEQGNTARARAWAKRMTSWSGLQAPEGIAEELLITAGVEIPYINKSEKKEREPEEAPVIIDSA